MLIHYLEVVTPDVDETCRALESLHGQHFGTPVAGLGGARTLSLKGGGLLGVRAPMRDDEQPVVRPYILTKDMDAAVEAARTAGADIALSPTEIPGHGKCAIYILGGIQHGLWGL
ncbi:MAG: hydroxylase [Planctomycetes bacterium]|nr:hydroxylase [Planctomycetota bacterium]